MSGTPLATKYLDAIQLSERERTMLVRAMEKSGTCDRRKHPRLMVEGKFHILVQLEYPGGSSANFRVQPWDLSRGGLGFFHRAYVHPGTRCTFTGNMTDGQPISIKGEVVRCLHVAGMVHTVGCKFEMEIDPEVFLGEGAMAAMNASPGMPQAQGTGLPGASGGADGSEAATDAWKSIETACAELNHAVNTKLGLEVIAEKAQHVAEIALHPPVAADPEEATGSAPESVADVGQAEGSVAPAAGA